MPEPFTAKRIQAACRDFGLPSNAGVEQIERCLHVRFQRLYRKPPDDWLHDESAQWDLLGRYLDIQAYQNDNPPTDTRIGLLIRSEDEEVVIRWNTLGEVPYDSRSIPAELLGVPIDWLIHAEFQMTNGRELWLSTHAEPPLSSDEDLILNDPSKASLPEEDFALADWPGTGD